MDVTTHLIVVLKQPQQPFVLRRQLDLALQPVDRTLSFACNLSLQTRVAIALVLALRSGGKLAGIFTNSVEDAKRGKEMGFRFIALGIDMGLFVDAAADMAGKLR